jgi:hypothetical protein
VRLRTLTLVPALAAAMLSIGTASAPAVTLFTSAALTTRVPVGATATLTSPNWQFTNGGLPLTTCTDAQVDVRISQNNDTMAIADTIGGSLTGCGPFTATPTFLPSSKITFAGYFSIPSYTAAVTQWDTYVVDTSNFGPTSTGNLNTRITTTRPLTGGPICITMTQARTLNTASPATRFISASFCFTGPAATWSFT